MIKNKSGIFFCRYIGIFLCFWLVGTSGKIPLKADIVSEQDRSFVILDGQRYTKQKVIDDFLFVAFSRNPWPFKRQDVFFKGQVWPQESHPWAYEYFVRDKGIPDSHGLTKWTDREISIGFGLPIYSRIAPLKTNAGEYCFSGLDCRCRLNQHSLTFDGLNKDKTDELVLFVTEQSKKIKEATGISIVISSICSSLELTADYPKMRIASSQYNRQKNFFKMFKESIDRTFLEEFWSYARNEASLVGGIAFTSMTRSQVDGYILPHADNTIGLTVCYIMPMLEMPMIKSLVSECLVRSMGLVEVSGAQMTILGNWNKEYDAKSKVVHLDGEQERLREPNWWPKGEVLEEGVTEIGKIREISEYDQALLAILYCEQLKPGMHAQEVKKILMDKNSSCLNFEKGYVNAN